jgi:hypothetical protein
MHMIKPKRHAAAQKKLPKSERSPFIPSHEMVSPKAGYIIWKDSKVVIFYSNDLANTPSKGLLHGDDLEAIDCVNGLGILYRWTRTEVMHRTAFLVLAQIVAYYLFMNGVDRLDQKQATNATKRKEKRRNMNIFLDILDLACTQAHSLLCTIGVKNKPIEFVEFKR